MAAAEQAANGKPWVVVEMGGRLCAVPSAVVESMVLLPEVVETPERAAHVRGVVKLRERVLPLVDLRVRLGMESLKAQVEGMCALLSAREEDHKKWLNELEKSVAEGRAFTLATDPHQCAFGKWYDAFKTEDLLLGGLMRAFDAPHKAIHAVAGRVTTMLAAGDRAGAERLIEATREGELATLVKLFESTRRHLRESTREVAVVIGGKQPFAMAVDRVESVEPLKATEEGGLPAGMAGECRKLVGGVAMRSGGRMVAMLEVGAVY